MAWLRRMPVVAHAAALLAVLCALAVVVGTGTSFSEDEGAAIVQARQLADHGSWDVPHPAADAYPSGIFYPYKASESGAKARAPFARHPAYVVALAALWRVGGINALVGLSLLGTVVAALGAARIADRLAPGSARLALWATGLGSPLFFDGFLVLAHTVGAAFAAWLAVIVVERNDRDAPFAALAAFGLAFGLVLVRTEGAFCVAAAASVLALARRLSVAAASAVGALSALALDRVWVRNIVGAPRAVATAFPALGNRFGVRGRIDAALTTLFRFSYDDGARANVLLLLALALTAAAALALRARARPAPLLAAAAAAAVVGRLFAAPPEVVPGLFVVTPVVCAGVGVGAFAFGDDRRRQLTLLLIVFAVAVLLTQYPQGGGVEWGGRYLALVLPAAVALSASALRAAPRSVLSALAVASIGLGALGLGAIHRAHERTATLLEAIPRHHDELVVTTAGLLPRLDWPNFENRQWLWVDPPRVDQVVEEMRARGVAHVAVVFPDALAPTGWEGRGDAVPGLPWRVVDVAG